MHSKVSGCSLQFKRENKPLQSSYGIGNGGDKDIGNDPASFVLILQRLIGLGQWLWLSW